MNNDASESLDREPRLANDTVSSIGIRRSIFRNIKTMSHEDVKIKTFLNNKKMDNFIFNKRASIRKVFPELDHDKIYLVNIFYKDIDEYRKDSLVLILLFDENQLCMFEFKNKNWYSTSTKYLKPIHDIELLGQSKKKISIHSMDEKIYILHVVSVHSDSTHKKKIYDFNKYVWIFTKDTICVTEELDKILHKYVYKISNIQPENCEIDNDERLINTSYVNKISIDIMIDRPKKIYQKLLEYFK